MNQWIKSKSKYTARIFEILRRTNRPRTYCKFYSGRCSKAAVDAGSVCLEIRIHQKNRNEITKKTLPKANIMDVSPGIWSES